MTFLLDTKTHGTIDSGFYGHMTQFTNFGDHTFATKHLCDLVAGFAEDPKKTEAGILSFDIDELERMQGDYMFALLELLDATHSPYEPVLSIEEMDIRLAKQQGKITQDQELALYDHGSVVPVQFDYTAREINVGKYIVEPDDFSFFMAYISAGGFRGWIDGIKPNFAADAQDALLRTRNPLLQTAPRSVRKYLDGQKKAQKRFGNF